MLGFVDASHAEHFTPNARSLFERLSGILIDIAWLHLGIPIVEKVALSRLVHAAYVHFNIISSYLCVVISINMIGAIEMAYVPINT
jgi:hypothetical protein